MKSCKLHRTLLLAVTSIGSAYAQIPYDLTKPCTGPNTALPVPVPVKPPGMPAQVAPKPGVPQTCGSYIVGYSAAGVVGGYWCQANPYAQPVHVMGAVRWSFFTPAMLYDLTAIPLAADQAEASRLFQAKYQSVNFYNMCDVWGIPNSDWGPRFMAAKPAVLTQPVSTWRVSSPIAFNVVGTTLSGVAGNVAIGTACDCSKPTKIGTTTYCTFTGAARPSVMAACKVAP